MRIVHVDQGAQASAGIDIAQECVIGIGDREKWPREVGEEGIVPLDIHDVGMFGDRPERPVRRNVDPGHRSLFAQMSECLVQCLFIGIGLRSGQHPPGGVADPVAGRCAH